jgi:acyl-CoA synthetase (NDP forming)
VFDAACRQAGLLRLDGFGDLFEVPKIFASQPLPRGNRMGIVTITGGVAVMAIDRGAQFGLRPTHLSGRTAALLDEIFPGAGQMPVDIGPMMAAVKDAFSHYPRILEAVLADANVDALLQVLWANPAGGITEKILRAHEVIRGRYDKPVATWVYGPNSVDTRRFGLQLEDLGFPVFKEPETAVKSLGLALRYAKRRGIAQNPGQHGEEPLAQ